MDKILETKKAILSTKLKSEKVLKKLKEGSFQYDFTVQGINAYNLILSIIEENTKESTKDRKAKDLLNDEKENAINFFETAVKRIEKVMPKLKESTPQYTLAKRRIDAFNYAILMIKIF